MQKRFAFKKNVLEKKEKEEIRNKTPDLSGFTALGGIKVTSSDSLLTVQLDSCQLRAMVQCSLIWYKSNQYLIKAKL